MGRRVTSTNPKVPASTTASFMDYDDAYFMHLIPGVVQGLPKGLGCIGFLSPMQKKIPDSFS